jgi:cytochrome c553
MRLPRSLLAAVLATASLAASAQAPAAAPKAGDAAAGKNKVYQCQGCHGVADWKTVFPETYRVPKLGGQKPGYIVAALRAYKSGERDFATMRGMVADMTEQDMADVAAYYGASNVTTAEKK